MCLFNQKTPEAPKLPPERAAQQLPDGGAVRDAMSRRTGDRVRSWADTILTSGSGVMAGAQTEKKTLLGA